MVYLRMLCCGAYYSVCRFVFARLNPHYNRKFIAEIDIFTTSHCNLCNVEIGGSSVDLRDLKMFLHLAEKSPLFGRSARAMHVILHAFARFSAWKKISPAVASAITARSR